VVGPRAAPELSVGAGLSFEEALAVQERLLRSGEPAVHVATLRDTVVSYGVGVDPQASYIGRVHADGVRTVRRPSGGSGIVHLPGDLVWAVVLPRRDPRVGRDFVRAYDRFGRGVATALAGFGASAKWVGAPGLSDDYCPLSSRGQVLEAGGRILAAAAQHATGAALLHHGVVVHTVDRLRIARWFALAVPGPADRLTSLSEQGMTSPPDEFARVLGDHLVAGLGPTPLR
jgi:lipoate-protein ligase A